jgi:hypothetical protein
MDTLAPPADLVNITECARLLGVNKSTISRQVNSGVIPNHGSGTSPMVSVIEARSARERGLDRSKQRGAGAPLFASPAPPAPEADAETIKPKEPLTYQVARTAREGFDARLAQLKFERECGELLYKTEVVDACFNIGQSLREMMERRRVAIAGRLSGVTDINAINGILSEEDDKLLRAIGEEFDRHFVKVADAAA